MINLKKNGNDPVVRGGLEQMCRVVLFQKMFRQKAGTVQKLCAIYNTGRTGTDHFQILIAAGTARMGKLIALA